MLKKEITVQIPADMYRLHYFVPGACFVITLSHELLTFDLDWETISHDTKVSRIYQKTILELSRREKQVHKHLQGIYIYIYSNKA